MYASFVLDKELAYVGYVELALAPLPSEAREVHGGTFYAFRLSEFVEFGPDAISDDEMQRRIDALSRTVPERRGDTGERSLAAQGPSDSRRG